MFTEAKSNSTNGWKAQRVRFQKAFRSGYVATAASATWDVETEIRDLDQTVIGNPAHDLVRLALSLSMAARSSDILIFPSVKMNAIQPLMRRRCLVELQTS